MHLNKKVIESYLQLFTLLMKFIHKLLDTQLNQSVKLLLKMKMNTTLSLKRKIKNTDQLLELLKIMLI